MNTLAFAAHLVADHAHLLADPTPTPAPSVEVPKAVNTGGIMRFLITVIAPILLGILGVAILARARRGDMSATMNSTAVMMVGVIILGGAFTLVGLGGWLTDILVK